MHDSSFHDLLHDERQNIPGIINDLNSSLKEILAVEPQSVTSTGLELWQVQS